jgi:hypothetical protein
MVQNFLSVLVKEGCVEVQHNIGAEDKINDCVDYEELESVLIGRFPCDEKWNCESIPDCKNHKEEIPVDTELAGDTDNFEAGFDFIAFILGYNVSKIWARAFD